MNLHVHMQYSVGHEGQGVVQVSQMDSGPPIPHTCVKYCQIPSCRGFSSQPNVGFFVSAFDILWLPDLTKSQPRYSCCSGSSKVFQCHGLPWTELERDGTREVDQVSFGRKSTIAIYEVVWCNCDASCFGKYLHRPKCFQKRDNVEKNVSTFNMFKYFIHGAPGI